MTTQRQILFVAFSHSLTQGQIQDAEKSLGIEELILLKDVDAEMQSKVSQIPASATYVDIIKLATDIVDMAQECGAKFFMIAGEPTLVLHASILAKNCGMEVVQSTTERISSEILQEDGSILKTAVFQHVQWRKVFG
jgi:hypothetical protein